MEANPEKSHLKGQAVIALAAAAGVIAASRLSRAGLVLAGGLAWHLWNSRKTPSPPPAQPGTAIAPPEADTSQVPPSAPSPQAADPAPDQGPESPADPERVSAAPEAPVLEAPDPDSHAWDDLRAALMPTLGAMPEAEEAPLPDAPCPDSEKPSLPAEVPAMPEFHLLPPTDPLIESGDPEPSTGSAPVSEQFEAAEPAGDPPDFLVDPMEEPSVFPDPMVLPPQIHAIPAPTHATPLTRSVQAPSIVARPDAGWLPAPESIQVVSEPGQADETPDAPTSATPPEEKKNFFDWLRSGS